MSCSARQGGTQRFLDSYWFSVVGAMPRQQAFRPRLPTLLYFASRDREIGARFVFDWYNRLRTTLLKLASVRRAKKEYSYAENNTASV
jgi:hypothetical protein